jgi:hypothetical protein
MPVHGKIPDGYGALHVWARRIHDPKRIKISLVKLWSGLKFPPYVHSLSAEFRCLGEKKDQDFGFFEANEIRFLCGMSCWS